MLPFTSWLAAIDVAVYLQVVRGRLSRFEELCLFVVGLVLLSFFMAPRRRRERKVVVQTSQQEARDAPPPPLAQPRPQDTHGGVVPPLPPQATQGWSSVGSARSVSTSTAADWFAARFEGSEEVSSFQEVD
ncbi:hypothetical protein Taro_018316 [Colocasia esculenta]|uniref:Uncharacterized protein n=1 Tax=Colocasia esculenta TaxID=4460 RepID=A0A843UQF7_COLES|nr:hypothetical protein [Colocasia esculenta]